MASRLHRMWWLRVFFPNSPQGKLGIARFKEQCCLRGLTLNGRQVTPDAVVKEYQAARATLELARFTAECCLGGLTLNGRQVTPDVVIKGYQAAGATLEIARFKAECCLRGLPLTGQQVTPDAVVNDFPDSPEGKLGIARFKEQCCLRGLALQGQLVTPEAVVKDFQGSPDGKLGIARFKEQCCLRGLTLKGQQVTPEAVVKAFPNSPEGKLGIARFKEQCCLRGLLLNGQQVTLDEVARDFKCGGWLLERAIFYAQLALSARALNGNYLDNREVLEAFNKVPGNHCLMQVEYLMQRLRLPQHYDETDEVQDALQEAWQILNSVPVRDDGQHRLKCLLQFMAMQYQLLIDHQSVSAEQVLQSINTLRSSFQNSRILFFFLAHCYITSQPVNGRQIHKDQVLECLHNFPQGSKLRHTLGFWFEQCCCEANVMDDILFNQKSTLTSRCDSDSAHRYTGSASQLSVANLDRECPFSYQIREYRNETFPTQAVTASMAQTLEPLSEQSTTDEPGFPNRQVPQLNALTLRTLEIIQEINGSYTAPPILITGSYARFLQELRPSFNDIDIICTTEKSARTLFDKLQANSDRDSEIPKSIIIWPMPGCQAIKRPNTYTIQLKDGDLGTRAIGLQVSVDARVTDGNTSRLPVLVPGVERPVWCLLFAEETRLMNDTLEYLADNLDPLTRQLQKGAVFDLPRTFLFNNPQNTEERIYALLECYLLTLGKARQFIALHSTGKPDCRPNQLQEEYQRLHALTANLQMKVNSHSCRVDFELSVNGWLSTTQPVNEHQLKRREFIQALLAMMHPEQDRFAHQLYSINLI